MGRRGTIRQRIAKREEIERPVRSKKYNEYFLIVCEDEFSEPYYFMKFQEMFDDILPQQTVFLKPVGTGRNSLGVVEQAILERQRLQHEANKHIDHTWVVFDKDNLDESEGNITRFKSAFVLANENNVQVAYSNECFELWLLLHYIDVDPTKPLFRHTDIYPTLEEAINKGRTESSKIQYDHKHPDKQVIDIIRKTGSQDVAIQRAEKLDSYHTQEGHEPINANPNTLVYKLVSKLNEMLAWYMSKSV